MRTIGKTRGLARLADADGHFRMVALDQRPPMFEAIAQAKKITRDQVAYADVTAAKRLLVEALAPHCSSMLFDPNFAVPAAIDLLPARCGLIMTLEEHRVEETPGGRKSRVDRQLERRQDPRHGRRRRQGAGLVSAGCGRRRQCASATLRARDRRGMRPQRHSLCARASGLSLPRQRQPHRRLCGIAGQAAVAGDRERARICQARIWRRSPEARELRSRPTACRARDGSAAAKAAQREFDAIGEICGEAGIPWVLLSGGAAHDKFERVLDYAYAAGAGGFLAGRTIWLDAVRTYFPDLPAVSAALNKESVAILNSLSELTKERAHSWQPCFPTFDHVRQEGDFARAY